MPTQTGKRPSIEALPAASSSSSTLQLHHPSQSATLYPLFASLIFHIVPAKLEDDIGVLYQSIEDLGGRCDGLEAARWVVSALKGRARLARVLDKWMDKKPVVSPEFVYDTYTRALEASTQRDTIPHLPDVDSYIVAPIRHTEPRLLTDSSDEDDRPAKRRKPNRDDHLPDMELYEEDIDLEAIPRYCVERPSPLVCVNQDLIDAIKPIYEARLFEERGQMNSNVLSYRRSMSVLKSIPRLIKSGKEAMRLLDVGEKVAARIDEFLQTGAIAESQEVLASPRFEALKLFASIFSIGHTTAKTLYDKYHCRTLEDVREHYEAITEEKPDVREKDKVRRRLNGGMKQVEIVEAWMGLKEGLDQSIPREEVEEIARCVQENLDAILPGCQHTLTGGYRRGKTKSSDVDVVFCPPQEGDDNGLLRDLYRRLTAMGIVTHVLQIMDRLPNMPISAAANNFDNLDKAFVIFRLPGQGRVHRRVDLISAPKERYAAAVLSWSGSMMFERDLKRYAEDRGLKFRAGLIESNTGREIYLEKERDIFHYLGLRYVPPHLRNADG